MIQDPPWLVLVITHQASVIAAAPFMGLRVDTSIRQDRLITCLVYLCCRSDAQESATCVARPSTIAGARCREYMDHQYWLAICAGTAALTLSHTGAASSPGDSTIKGHFQTPAAARQYHDQIDDGCSYDVEHPSLGDDQFGGGAHRRSGRCSEALSLCPTNADAKKLTCRI